MRVHRLPNGKRICSFSNRQIQVEFLFCVVVIVPFEDKAEGWIYAETRNIL